MDLRSRAYLFEQRTEGGSEGGPNALRVEDRAGQPAHGSQPRAALRHPTAGGQAHPAQLLPAEGYYWRPLLLHARGFIYDLISFNAPLLKQTRKPRLPLFNGWPKVRLRNGEMGGKILKIHQVSKVGSAFRALSRP